MKFSSIWSEACRNVASGASRAVLFLLAVLICALGLGGVELGSITSLEQQAAQRIAADADISTVIGGKVDGTACDRLAGSGPQASGAMRTGPSVRLLASTGRELSSYEVTPGMLAILAGSGQKADSTGVWVSSLMAGDFGLSRSSTFETTSGRTHVAGVYDWPRDGRDSRFAYSILIPVSPSSERFEECWARRWPVSSGTDQLLESTVIATGSATDSNIAISRVNKGFDQHYDAASSYLGRPSRLAGLLGLVAGVLIGFAGIWRRRLLYAADLHSGQSKADQLLEMLCEEAFWAWTGVVCAVVLLAGAAVRLVRSDPWAVWAASVRPVCLVLCGVVCAQCVTCLCVRQSQLFRLFKNR